MSGLVIPACPESFLAFESGDTCFIDDFGCILLCY